MLADAAKLFAAEAAAAYLATPGGAVLRGVGPQGGDLPVDALVGRLRVTPVETAQGTLADRERVTLQIERRHLVGVDYLSERQVVDLPGYPGAGFNVVPAESIDGDLVTLVVARKPLRTFADKRRRGDG